MAVNETEIVQLYCSKENTYTSVCTHICAPIHVDFVSQKLTYIYTDIYMYAYILYIFYLLKYF